MKFMSGRNVVFLTLAGIAIALVILVYRIKPVTDLKSARAEADRLIASVGGPAKVCDEANQMFKCFGVSKQRFFFNASELEDYPAIAGLGTVDRICIYPGSPPYIAIRVGTHLNGFSIDIADTNRPEKYASSPNVLELVHSCVFVHR
jgi:hypothetical protein